MLRTVRAFLGMIRFSHTIFALPFALMSAALAWMDVAFRAVDLLGIVLCMVFARSAAMAFNRLADRRIDASNPRTAGRHIPSGQLSVAAVWAFTLLSGAGFFASTLLFLPNRWPVYLAGPVLIFVCLYSLTKRFTALVHFWLGASLMLAPIAAWIALRGLDNLAMPATLGAAVLFWVAGFDILYACQDMDFDRQAGLHSVPAWLGVRASLRVAAACHAVMLGLLLGLKFLSPHLGAIYLIGLSAIAVLVVYEHWLVRPDDLTRVNHAFFQVNGVISVGLLLIVVVQLLWK
ncbi:MAG: UbiA-like polyprenyltransferase [Gemmataceae bacterium]